MMLQDITVFLGHLHPVIVHLPIGFLSLGVIFEFLSWFKKYHELKPAVSITLLLGFASATFASVFGYLLSLGGSYDPHTLMNHKVGGIALAVISGLLFLLTTPPFQKIFSARRRIFSALCLILFLLVTYTGHLGGSLTHGGDYLSLNLITETGAKKSLNIEEALLFEDVVQPILNNKCAQCHREGKMKGGLSVQTFDGLIKGGKSKSAVVGGNLEKSELYKRITLDPSNEKHMPADGKTPLTPNETLIIKWWIEKGMAGKGEKIGAIKGAEEIRPQVSQSLGLGEVVKRDEIPVNAKGTLNSDIPLNFNLSLLDTLKKQGLNVRLMMHKPVMLDITWPAGSGSIVNGLRSALKVVAKNVIWLNLSNNGLTENELDFLPEMTNLEKLRLDKNPVTDQITRRLEGLNHLEALNLNETKISGAALEKLKQLPNLKRVYSWHTFAK